MKDKTWKRELAVGFAILLGYEICKNNVEMVEVIIWPVLSFIAAASGLHIYDKTQRNTRSVLTDPSPDVVQYDRHTEDSR